MQRLMMRKHVLSLRHLQHFLNGQQVWSPFVKWDFSQFVSLMEQQYWFKYRPRKGTWHLECRQALTAFCQSSIVVGGSCVKEFYRRILTDKSDNDPGGILGVERDQLTDIFRGPFGPEPMDNFQKSLAWQYQRNALLIRDQLYRLGSAVRRPCPKRTQCDDTVLYAHVRCPCITDLWSFVKTVGVSCRMDPVINQGHREKCSAAFFQPEEKSSFPLPDGYSEKGSVVSEAEGAEDKTLPSSVEP